MSIKKTSIDLISAKKERISVVANDPLDKESYALQLEQKHEQIINSQNLGLLGKLFGSRATAVTNMNGFAALVASGVILVCLVYIGISMFCNVPWDKEKINILVSLVTLALGYLFGKAGR